jgi:hypothetical protein
VLRLRPHRSRRPGHPEHVVAAVDAGGTPAVAQASEIVVVRRSDLQVEVDMHFKCSQAGCGVTVIFRAQMFSPAWPARGSRPSCAGGQRERRT